MTILLVTEERSWAGAAAHPVLRAYYWFVAVWRAWALRRFARRLSRRGVLTILATAQTRALLASAVPHATFASYEALQERLPYERLRGAAWADVRRWSDALASDPELTVGGIRLPAVFETQVALQLLSTVYKYEGLVEQLLGETPTDLVAVLSAHSPSERVALEIAHRHGRQTAVGSSLGLGRPTEWVERFLRRREKRVVRDMLRRLSHDPPAVPLGEGEIWLIASHPTHHVKILTPLGRKLEERWGRRTRLLTDWPDVERLMAPYGPPPSRSGSIAGLLGPEIVDRRTARLQSTFRRRWAQHRRAAPHAQYPFTVIGPLLENLFTFDIPSAAAALPVFQRLAARHRPAAVITASDRRINEVLLPMVARQQSVPTILATAITNLSLEMANNYDTCDVVAVPGDSVREKLLELGRAPEEVRVVGDLRFDDLPERVRRFDPATFKQSLGIAPTDQVVVLVSSDIGPTWTIEKKRHLFQAVHAATRPLAGTRLLIRAHPNESRPLLAHHLQAWGLGDVPVDARYHLHDVLLASSVVVMLYSMTGLEAMLLTRPVVNVTLEGENVEHYLPYVSGGGALGVTTEAELGDALRRLVSDTAFYHDWVARGQRFVARFIRPVDGQVVDRINALINELAARRSR